jgi:hypothetical protein
MDTFDFQATGPMADWLIFLVVTLAACLPIVIFVVWRLAVGRKKGRKTHRKHGKRHKRQLNPTLAQSGGLPPLRGPDEPPHGV